MDLRCLNTFIQVAELSSFTKAGDKLGYSQPTVSFQIKQLEDEIGGKLFERIGHTVRLTDKGRRMLSYAQNICRLSDEMVNEAHAPDEPSGGVRIAMAASLCSPLVVDRFDGLRQKFPHISLKIHTAGTDEMFEMIDHNETDILCTLDSHIYDTSYVIVSEEKIGVHFVCAVKNDLAYKKNISIEDIANTPLLLTEKGMSYRKMLDKYLAERSMEIVPTLELGDADLLCRLAEKDLGLSFLPDYVTEEAVKKGRLVRLEVEDMKIVLWKQILIHKDKWVSPQIQAVIGFLSDRISE